MFLVSAQNNFYIILSSYVKGYLKSEFHVFSWFPCLQNLAIFWKTYCRASLETLSLENLLAIFLSFFFFFFFFFFAFLSCHFGLMNCFEILNFVFSNVIPGGVSICKILTFPNFGVFSLTVTSEEQFLLIRTRSSP